MRILVVEDDEKILTFLEKGLKAECFAVDVAKDGGAGLKLARINEYDLLVLDNLMPEKSGLEICEELRGEGYTTPILILSVATETDIKVRALNSGADDYLTKPFSFNELVARIRALLRRQPQLNEPVLEIGDLTLDTQKHQVLKSGKDVPLTRKEFMLLEYMMRNSGIALSRGMLLEHVWDMNADPFSNTIESHVLSLRKKLDANNKHKYIKTVSGVGYRFVAETEV